MQGIVTTATGRYLFRDDHAHGTYVWAWNTHDEVGTGDRVMTHKWQKLPAGEVELFGLDSPPATVSYQPLLSDD
jgi:hypothetical protein